MTDASTDAARVARWRKKLHDAGGRTICAALGPDAARALEQLTRDGTSVRQAIEAALLREAAAADDRR